MARKAIRIYPGTPGKVRITLALSLLMAVAVVANVLRVPEDFAEVQQAMDASAAGDTVVVARGTWVGLLQSPTHSLVLCSQFIFSQDSTYVNETILDGEYQGTLLTVNTAVGTGLLELNGLTLTRGQGQQTDIYANCDRGGALHVVEDGNLIVRSCVFTHNRSSRSASVLFYGIECALYGVSGYLCLENLYLEDNRNDGNGSPSIQYGSINIFSQGGRVELHNIRYNGASATTNSPIHATVKDPLAFSVDGIEVWNCDGGEIAFGLSSDGHAHYTIQNIRTYTTNDTLNGCSINFGALGSEDLPFTCTWNNVEVSGIHDNDISMGGNNVHFRYNGIHVHHCSNTTRSILGIGLHSAAGSSEIHDLVFHHNTSGDSIDQVPDFMIALGGTDVYGAHVYDNHVIIPPDPLVSETGGHYLRRGSILNAASSLEQLGEDGAQRYEGLLFENNFVDDLDDYSNLHPETAPHENEGREMYLTSPSGIVLSNVVIRNSRQPNHTPELYAPTYMTLSTAGSCIGAYANRIHVIDTYLENCDDGGFQFLGTEDSVFFENVVLRNVGRCGIETGTPVRFRNVLIDNVDAIDNCLYLTPYVDRYTMQSAMFILGSDEARLENVTITGCDDMRRPIGYSTVNPIFVTADNTMICNNTYEMLVELNGNASWSHCYVQEAVEGEGNIIGNDPLFDPERGIPFLAPDSPCIDAGNPDAAYNDIEDPDAPGFALWPSQGGLRNDIGCTGGPFANDSMFVSVAPVRPITLPTSPTLGNAYPNPFNPVTTIPFVIQQPVHLRLSVYNLRGQLVATLADGEFFPGEHRVAFDGAALASGVYLISLRGEGVAETRKALLLK